MGTIADKLDYLIETKNILKTNLINKKVDIPDGTTFRQMAQMVNEISTISKYTITVKANNGINNIEIDGHSLNSGETYKFEKEAGDFINFNISSDVGFQITENVAKTKIPTESGSVSRALPPMVLSYYFVMPKGDITLEGP